MQNLLLQIWGGIQRHLFPALHEEAGPLTEQDQRFVQVLALLRLDPLLAPYAPSGIGRPPDSRRSLALAYTAKAVYNFPTTRALIEALAARPSLRRMCGYERASDIPGESTFSRAFEEFAVGQLPQALHRALIEDHATPRLVGHVSRDATAIEAREKPLEPKSAARADAPPPPKRKRGRPRKGEEPPPQPPKRLELQPTRSLSENLADLPRHCTWGCKRNSRGNVEFWCGYKLHLDVIDGDIPVSAILSAANLHDSQAAIPLAQMTAERVPHSLYDLMDSAYDAAAIRAYSHRLGHVPIIDPNPQRAGSVPLAPAEAVRFGERTAVERVNSNLKDNYGGRQVRVRGATKVMAHLMFGLVALTAVQWFAWAGAG
jgi:hypothetical protein